MVFALNAQERKTEMKKIKSILCLLLCAAMIFSLAACSDLDTHKNASSRKLKVVCTMFPQYDFLREIAGDKIDLTLLVPPGVESHSYDPTPKDMKRVAMADLVVRIGEDMETWSDSLFDSDTSDAEFLSFDKALDLELASHHHEHTEEIEAEHHHEHDGTDAHIWTNPLMAVKMVEVLKNKLCKLDPDNAQLYKTNAEKYTDELKKLDKGIKETVANSPKKTLVFSGRFAFKNFTDAYGLNYISTLDACADNSEPSAASVAKIIDVVEKEKIKVIFYEELIEPKTAKTISAETGTKMLLFHSCHNLTKEEFSSGQTYLSLMKQNLENLKEALA